MGAIGVSAISLKERKKSMDPPRVFFFSSKPLKIEKSDGRRTDRIKRENPEV